MAQQSASAEPSMEEILASIRRIISDEHTEQAEEQVAAPAVADAAAPETEINAPIPIADEIDDTAVMPEFDPAPVEDEALSLELPTAPAPQAAEQPELTTSAAAQPEEIFEAPLELTQEADEVPVADTGFYDEPLVLDAPLAEPVEPPVELPEEASSVPAMDLAERVMDNASAQLPAGLLEPETDAAVANGFAQLEQALAARHRSLEDLTDSVLRPMVKTWLDDNLPQLVERLVREEIQRVARGS
ncbi:MAG: DUF2497 domain-containing protein [Pseudomonadota bacterium]